MKWGYLVLIIFCVFVIVTGLEHTSNPYAILGVTKSATLQEIRKAYKKLAKEWHPDKNDDPAAANNFVEITQAYELLTDPERRRLYDLHGVINPDSIKRTRRDYQFSNLDPFDDLFGFQFNTQDPDITLLHKLSITTRAFENNLLPKSHVTPHLILFYSDWCFSCLKIEPLWRRIVEELEPIGIEVATVHNDNEPNLAKKCGVPILPSLVLLIDGKHYLYREPTISVQRVVEFIRSKFPYRLIQPVNDINVDTFLSGWKDNRVRALIVNKAEVVRLRYLLTAYHYRDRISFGFVRIGTPSTEKIQRRYKVSTESETLLLFNENTARPIASLSMNTIPVQTMRDIISANKYLILPRLSSQNVLDAVCPIEWALQRKRLCVVLVSQNTEQHDNVRQGMRRFIQEATFNSQRVHFSYIYLEKQSEFIQSLTDSNVESRTLSVVIIWRRDANRLKYEWIPGQWSAHDSPQWNDTKEKLESAIVRLLRADQTLTSEALVKELIDEHAQGLLGKLIARILITMDMLRDSMEWNYVLAISTVIVTVGAIVGGGYLMAYLVKLEEEKVRAQESDCANNNKANGGIYTPQLRIHELRAEKYNGMVRLLKPGCRTIVLLLDPQSKATLLPAFHKIVWPYRKNKTLMFGFMFIERGIDWYKRLLTLSLPEPRQLNINPRNCIGTVLCLNGHRKYFCMYHAKHPECTTRGSKRMVRMARTLSEKNDRSGGRVGGFMGFDESSDSDSDTPIDVEQGVRITTVEAPTEDKYLLQSSLLDGLPNWLDRLFEGTTHRYHINYWPDFPTK